MMENPFDLNPFEDDDDNHKGLEDDVFLSCLHMAYNVMVYGRKKATKKWAKSVVARRMSWSEDLESRRNDIFERTLPMSLKSFY